MIEYAVYKGEELLVVGTSKECADFLGVKIETIHWYSTPTAKKRLTTRKRPEKCITVERIFDED